MSEKRKVQNPKLNYTLLLLVCKQPQREKIKKRRKKGKVLHSAYFLSLTSFILIVCDIFSARYGKNISTSSFSPPFFSRLNPSVRQAKLLFSLRFFSLDIKAYSFLTLSSFVFEWHKGSCWFNNLDFFTSLSLSYKKLCWVI